MKKALIKIKKSSMVYASIVLHILLLWDVNTRFYGAGKHPYAGRHPEAFHLDFDLTLTLCVLISFIVTFALTKLVKQLNS